MLHRPEKKKMEAIYKLPVSQHAATDFDVAHKAMAYTSLCTQQVHSGHAHSKSSLSKVQELRRMAL